MGRGSTDQNDTLEPMRRSEALPASPSDLAQWLLANGISQSMQVLVLVLRKLQDSKHGAVRTETVKSALAQIDWVALGREQELDPSHLLANARKPMFGLVEFTGSGTVKLTPAGRAYAKRIDQDGSAARARG